MTAEQRLWLGLWASLSVGLLGTIQLLRQQQVLDLAWSWPLVGLSLVGAAVLVGLFHQLLDLFVGRRS